MAGKLSGNSGKLSKRGGIRALRGVMLRFFRLRASAHEKAHGNRNRKLGKYRGDRGGEHHIGREILGGQRGCGGVIAHSAADGHGKAGAVGQTEQPPGKIAQAEADDSHEDGGQHQKQQGAVQMVQLIGAAGDVGAHDQQQHQLGGQRQPALEPGAGLLAPKAAQQHGNGGGNHHHEQ